MGPGPRLRLKSTPRNASRKVSTVFALGKGPPVSVGCSGLRVGCGAGRRPGDLHTGDTARARGGGPGGGEEELFYISISGGPWETLAKILLESVSYSAQISWNKKEIVRLLCAERWEASGKAVSRSLSGVTATWPAAPPWLCETPAGLPQVCSLWGWGGGAGGTSSSGLQVGGAPSCSMAPAQAPGFSTTTLS